MKKSTLILPAVVAGGVAVTAATMLNSCGTAAKAEKTEREPMNIVYIMTDDHTAQMMSAYDTRHIETPNLDRIANDGVKFTNSYVANSLSGPSRACMLTGKHSHANGFTDNTTCVFDASQPIFPKYLGEAGYETAIFGKWHLESLPQGFGTWEIVPGQGDYYNPRFIEMNGDTIVEQGYLTNIITDKSIDWLENKRDKDKPFCLLIHHKAIHRNWLPDTADLALYEDKVFELPETFYDDYQGREAAGLTEMRIFDDLDLIYDLKMDSPDSTSRLKETYLEYVGRMNPDERAKFEAFYQPIRDDFFSRKLEGKELAEWKYQRYMRDYAKVVKSLDDNVGRVLDYLDKNGLLDNTLVVYTSDQGFYMGEHGWFDKRFMYEESLNTPLVMMLPKGMDRKGEITEPVQNIDYAPTFLELAGVAVPEDMHGKSFAPLLRGDKVEGEWRPDGIYYHFYEYPGEHCVRRHYGVRDDRYKLMHFYNDIDQWELYDLQNDPNELNNLYGKPGYEEVTKTMMGKLKRLQEQYKDPISEKYPIND